MQDCARSSNKRCDFLCRDVKIYLEDKTNPSCLNLASLQLIPHLTTRVNFLKCHYIISWFKFLQFLALIDIVIPLWVKFSFSKAFQVLHGLMPATSQTSSYHPLLPCPTKQTRVTYLTWCSYSCHPHSSLLLAWLTSYPPPQNSVKLCCWIDTISEGRERDIECKLKIWYLQVTEDVSAGEKCEKCRGFLKIHLEDLAQGEF